MGDGSGKWWDTPKGPVGGPEEFEGAPGGGGGWGGAGGNPANGGSDPDQGTTAKTKPSINQPTLKDIGQNGWNGAQVPSSSPSRGSYPSQVGTGAQAVLERARRYISQGTEPVSALQRAASELHPPDGRVELLYNRAGFVNGGYAARGGIGLQIDGRGTIWITEGAYRATQICKF
jgi:hypothetical protein